MMQNNKLELMKDENSITLFILYYIIIIKRIILDIEIIDFQLILLNVLSLFILFVTINNSISKYVFNICKFIIHIIFIYICFTFIYDIMKLFYSFTFYFGFIKTIIVINIFIIINGFVNLIINKIYINLSKTYLGNKILNMINDYYNVYIAPKKIGYHLCLIFKNILYYCKQYINRLWKLNVELSNNEQSQNIINYLDNKYQNAKMNMIEMFIKPYFIKLMENMLNNDINYYKDILDNDDIYMDDISNIDDDLDMDINNISNDNKNENINIVDEKKKKLKKRILEKKAIRVGDIPRKCKYVNSKSMNKDLFNLTNMPSMNEMMETMLKSDNIEKIMKQLPPEKLNMQTPNMDPELMKQLMQSMMNKN